MLKIEEVTTEDTYELRVIDARGEETVSYIGTDELIIESDEEDYEPDDSMLECGYDPYMGCYSDDC